MTTLAKSDPNRAGRRPDALLADLDHGRYGGWMCRRRSEFRAGNE